MGELSVAPSGLLIVRKWGFHIFFQPTSAFTGGAPCAPYGATPCSTLSFFRDFISVSQNIRKIGQKIAFLGS